MRNTSSSFDAGPGPAMEVVVTPYGTCYTLSVKLFERRRGEGPDGHLLLPNIDSLRGLSALSQIMPLAHVSVDYQGADGDLLRRWSICPQTGACGTEQMDLLAALAELNPLVLSFSGISLMALDLSIISYFSSLTELKILSRSEVNPASLVYLKRLPNLRRLTVDASMVCRPSEDSSEAYWFAEMADALTELCQGPFGCGGHVMLQYTCVDGYDADDCFDTVETLTILVKQRLREGAQGELPHVEIEVEWVPE